MKGLKIPEGVEMVDVRVTRSCWAPGTSGWLARRLRDARVVLSETRSGRPAAFLEAGNG